jgi:hypothetical protein
MAEKPPKALALTTPPLGRLQIGLVNLRVVKDVPLKRVAGIGPAETIESTVDTGRSRIRHSVGHGRQAGRPGVAGDIVSVHGGEYRSSVGYAMSAGNVERFPHRFKTTRGARSRLVGERGPGIGRGVVAFVVGDHAVIREPASGDDRGADYPDSRQGLSDLERRESGPGIGGRMVGVENGQPSLAGRKATDDVDRAVFHRSVHAVVGRRHGRPCGPRIGGWVVGLDKIGRAAFDLPTHGVKDAIHHGRCRDVAAGWDRRAGRPGVGRGVVDFVHGENRRIVLPAHHIDLRSDGAGHHAHAGRRHRGPGGPCTGLGYLAKKRPAQGQMRGNRANPVHKSDFLLIRVSAKARTK